MPTDRRHAHLAGPVPALSARGVSKCYGSTIALEHVDLEIMPGKVVGLLGPNGAGKSTLMSLIAGLLRIDSGEIEVWGHSVARNPRPARRDLGLAPQTLGVYPSLTVRQNLRFFADMAGLRRSLSRSRIEELAESLGLAPLIERRVFQLSGGEQRRVHTAMALLHRPRLVLLDEPTAGVDVETRTRLIDHVRGLAATGTAVCYSTHYLPEIEALDCEVAVLHQGRIVAQGQVAELLRRYGDAALELVFSGAAPHLDLPWPVIRQGDVLKVQADQPELATARVLTALGEEVERLLTMRVLRPSLDSVFLRLTGRRPDDEAGTEQAVVEPERARAARHG
ncbi:ATP-binding cassette domain-containing protein [Streptomyces sp. NPDC057433]|uniref:ABC transporter ATP-binding protein n=1 Tax=Streptomyces sp. NPDC057433 TaxID=3346132 RepID=UPI0036B7586B